MKDKVLAYFPNGPLKPISDRPEPLDEPRWTKAELKQAKRRLSRKRIRRRSKTWRPYRKKPSSDRREYYRTVYLKSDHWKGLRSEKLKVNPCCEMCGSDKRIEPHHLRYRNLYDVQVSDLQTLCRKCHTLEHLRLDSLKRNRKVHAFDKSEQGTSRRDQLAGEFRKVPGVEADQRAGGPV